MLSSSPPPPRGTDSGNCGNDEGGKGKGDGSGQGKNDEGDPLEALEAAGAIYSFTDHLRENALEELCKGKGKGERAMGIERSKGTGKGKREREGGRRNVSFLFPSPFPFPFFSLLSFFILLT